MSDELEAFDDTLPGWMSREDVGKLVRQTWIDYCREIGDTKPSHLAPWEELSEQDKEADRRIGDAVVNAYKKWDENVWQHVLDDYENDPYGRGDDE